MVNQEFIDTIIKINETGRVVLEFGLQTIHPEEMKIIDRPNNMRKVERILQDVNSAKIESEISIIFGLPGQTLESFKASVQYCIDSKVKTIHAFPLMLLRGTPLYEEKDVYGLVESNEIVSEFIPRIQTDIPHVVSSNTFTYNE